MYNSIPEIVEFGIGFLHVCRLK